MCFLHTHIYSSQRVLRSLRCRLQVCLITDKLELVEWVAFLLHAFFDGNFYCVSFLELRREGFASWPILIKPWEWRLGYVHVKFCCFQLEVCFEVIISSFDLSAREDLELHMPSMSTKNCVWPFLFLTQVDSSWVTHLRHLNLSLPLIIHDFVILRWCCWVSFSHCQL